VVGNGTLRPDLETHRRYPNGRLTNSNHGWAAGGRRWLSPSGKRIDFLVIYAPTGGSDDPDAALEDQEVILHSKKWVTPQLH